VYICNGILFCPRKEEIILFAGKWMELKDIILSELSQKEKGYIISFICGR
jgi:hypothetical protein